MSEKDTDNQPPVVPPGNEASSPAGNEPTSSDNEHAEGRAAAASPDHEAASALEGAKVEVQGPATAALEDQPDDSGQGDGGRAGMPADQGWGGRVTFAGDVPFAEMPQLYRRAWVLAHASRTGSLDKVVLEAAACGTPVVSSAPSSRAILDAVPGSSVPDGDDEAFVARVREVLGWSTERRDAAGRALRAAVESGHSLDHWADRVTSAIWEVG